MRMESIRRKAQSRPSPMFPHRSKKYESGKSTRNPQAPFRLRFVSDESGSGDRGCLGKKRLRRAYADWWREVALLSDPCVDTGWFDGRDIASYRLDEGSGRCITGERR